MVMTFAGFMPASLLNQQGTIMEKPKVIQLLGQARSGKNFTAERLKSYFESQNKIVELYSYAAPMKQIASTLFDISLEQLDDYKNDPTNISIEVINWSGYAGLNFDKIDLSTNFRTFLQLLGNEAIKPIFGDDVWANLAQKHINTSSADIIIIPDCRFTVELNAIGGTTIRVVNHDLPAPMNHPSELELADVPTTYILDNTGYKATTEQTNALAQLILSEATTRSNK